MQCPGLRTLYSGDGGLAEAAAEPVRTPAARAVVRVLVPVPQARHRQLKVVTRLCKKTIYFYLDVS